MIVLEPGEQFTIVRQLANHTDTSTYYVRATIRDSKTDTLIDRFGLSDKGDRRYATPWQVVADPSGLGRYIDILTETFTDATYTTKADTYGDEMETYKVQSRQSMNLGGGYGGGSDIDYKLIRKIFEKVLDEKLKGFKFPEFPKQRFGEVLGALTELKQAIKAIKVTPTVNIPPLNVQPIVSTINTSQKAILEAVEVMRKKDKKDIAPLVECLEGMDVEGMEEKIRAAMATFAKVMEEIDEWKENMPETMDKMQQLISSFQAVSFDGLQKQEHSLKIKRIAERLTQR